MEKPYDLKALGQAVAKEAKAEGLVVVEEGLEVLGAAVYKALKAWLHESANLTPTQIDDYLVQLTDRLDPFVLEQIKKIDLDGIEQ